MKTQRQIKNFILKTLLPYKKTPTICGYNEERGICAYLTEDGRKCAVGRWMKKGEWQQHRGTADQVLYMYEDILLKPARDMYFSLDEWNAIQKYHDAIATSKYINIINKKVDNLEEIFELELPELRM